MPGAERKLNKIPDPDATRIKDELCALADEPYPRLHVKKLREHPNSPLYSHHMGQYRIVLAIEGNVMAITVIEVGDRSKCYRKYYKIARVGGDRYPFKSGIRGGRSGIASLIQSLKMGWLTGSLQERERHVGHTAQVSTHLLSGRGSGALPHITPASGLMKASRQSRPGVPQPDPPKRRGVRQPPRS